MGPEVLAVSFKGLDSLIRERRCRLAAGLVGRLREFERDHKTVAKPNTKRSPGGEVEGSELKLPLLTKLAKDGEGSRPPKLPLQFVRNF
jgi:hypothetical protein